MRETFYKRTVLGSRRARRDFCSPGTGSGVREGALLSGGEQETLNALRRLGKDGNPSNSGRIEKI